MTAWKEMLKMPTEHLHNRRQQASMRVCPWVCGITQQRGIHTCACSPLLISSLVHVITLWHSCLLMPFRFCRRLKCNQIELRKMPRLISSVSDVDGLVQACYFLLASPAHLFINDIRTLGCKVYVWIRRQGTTDIKILKGKTGHLSRGRGERLSD